MDPETLHSKYLGMLGFPTMPATFMEKICFWISGIIGESIGFCNASSNWKMLNAWSGWESSGQALCPSCLNAWVQVVWDTLVPRWRGIQLKGLTCHSKKWLTPRIPPFSSNQKKKEKKKSYFSFAKGMNVMVGWNYCWFICLCCLFVFI